MIFLKTAERLLELEKLRGETRENTGEDIEEEILAEVFLPTMGASCQSEIVALRIKIGTGERAMDITTAKCDDLAEYAHERVHRERTLVPMAPAKMDVSWVDTGGHFSAAASAWDTASSYGGQPYVEPVAFGEDQSASGCIDL